MQEALSQTVVILRRHPILWLPQLCAVLFSLVVDRLYNLTAGAIWHLLWHSRSIRSSSDVFGMMAGTEVPTKGLLMARAALQTPLLLLSIFLEVTLYALAFALVIIFVQRFMQGLPAQPRSVFPSAKPKSPDIVYVALITVCLFMLKLLLVVPIMSLMTAQPNFSEMPFWYFQVMDCVTQVALILATIYFITPTAVKMADSGEPSPPSTHIVRSSRRLAMAVAIFWFLLQIGWRGADHAMFMSFNNHRFLWLWVLQFIPTLTTVVALTFISVALAIFVTNKTYGSLNDGL